MANQTLLDILLAVKGVNQCALLIFSDGVHGQVATLQIFFQGDIGRGVELKAMITAR